MHYSVFIKTNYELSLVPQYGSDEFGHDSPSRYASPKSAGAPAQYQEPYYAGEWGAQYYQPPAPAPVYQHDVYATSPGTYELGCWSNG